MPLSAARVFQGDLSTKVQGVIRCLLQIHRDDPEAKCLVFSTWADVLDLMGQALMANHIEFRSLHAHNKFQSNLSQFQHSSSVQVLLLPVHSGANGLNLTEATHVLFVEPVLNPAQELQAIGRVHRIGQTRPTVVHRFIVRGTIEERMYKLLQTVQAPLNSHSSEETTLTVGEFSSLFEEELGKDEEDSEEEGEEQSTSPQTANTDSNTSDQVTHCPATDTDNQPRHSMDEPAASENMAHCSTDRPSVSSGNCDGSLNVTSNTHTVDCERETTDKHQNTVPGSNTE